MLNKQLSEVQEFPESGEAELENVGVTSYHSGTSNMSRPIQIEVPLIKEIELHFGKDSKLKIHLLPPLPLEKQFHQGHLTLTS